MGSLVYAFSSVKARFRVNLPNTEFEIQHPADELMTIHRFLLEVDGERTNCRPRCCWLPRGRATALRGGATELMGDVVVILFSTNQQEDEQRKAERETEVQTHKMDEWSNMVKGKMTHGSEMNV